MPSGVYRRNTPIEDRISEKFEINHQTGCWEWVGTIDNHGYGFLKFKGENIRAYRLAWLIFVGEIIPGLVLDHLCRNRRCINPDHLEEVTFKENVLRGEGMAARHSRKTHCKFGHEFTPENTIPRAGGKWRLCKICSVNFQSKYRKEHREKMIRYSREYYQIHQEKLVSDARKKRIEQKLKPEGECS